MTFINKRNIYGNEHNAGALCEYQRELKLIKRLINISEKAVEQQAPMSAWSYEGICHSVATMLRLSRNESVNTEALAKICAALNCGFDDIMEVVD